MGISAADSKNSTPSPVNWVRQSLAESAGDSVFGMEDGTVSIFGLVLGVAASSTTSAPVLLAGATGAVAAAVSMMAGVFLDVQTSKGIAQAEDGTEHFVKFIGNDQRRGDVLVKICRFVFFRGLTSPAPLLTPTQEIEHEAYLMLLAQKYGVRTPDVEFTAHSADFALLAQRRVPGHELGALDAEEASDGLLIEIWKQVASLHAARICHNDLRLANILADEQKHGWIIDFGLAVADADDRALHHDNAQLLTSMTCVVEAERAVTAARSVLGQQALVGTVPQLIRFELSSDMRAKLRKRPEVLEQVKQPIVGNLPAA